MEFSTEELPPLSFDFATAASSAGVAAPPGGAPPGDVVPRSVLNERISSPARNDLKREELHLALAKEVDDKVLVGLVQQTTNKRDLVHDSETSGDWQLSHINKPIV